MEANYLERPVMPAAARNREAARLLRCRAMSALGQKQTLERGIRDVRFTSKSGHDQRRYRCRQSAKNRHSQCLNNDLACVLFVYLPQVLLEWPRLCDFRFCGCLGAGQNLEPDLEINKG